MSETNDQKGELKCPRCGAKLFKVRQSPNSMLNPEQFDAVRAGDWFCQDCRHPDDATRFLYFWDRELNTRTPAAVKESLTAQTADQATVERTRFNTVDELVLETMPPNVQKAYFELAEKDAAATLAKLQATVELVRLLHDTISDIQGGIIWRRSPNAHHQHHVHAHQMMHWRTICETAVQAAEDWLKGK